MDIAIAGALVNAAFTFVRPALVKQSSMEPTMSNNDYTLLNRKAYDNTDPKRGDIIVFRTDRKDSRGNEKLLIKRIIGIPGDLISIRGGELFLNGVRQHEDYVLNDFTKGEINDLTVPPGRYFVMGDNRGNSIDSRNDEIGCIRRSDILGKAFVRLFPFDRIGTI